MNIYNSELKVNETLLSTYLNKLLTVSSFNESDARILERSDNASLINSNDSLKRIIYFLIIWLIVSFIFVAIIIFLDFYGLFNKFQINSQIKEKTGIDSLGVIPHLSNFKLDYPIRFKMLKNKVFTDNIKKIIHKITKKNNGNACLISSPSSSDGKTFITILFAFAAQELGKKYY